MRQLAILSGLLLSAAPASAQPSLSEQIMQCWSPVVMAPYEKFEAEFEIIIDADGYLEDATVREFLPSTEVGRLGVHQFVRAMQRCSPYDRSFAGAARVNLKSEMKSPVDPFKGR